MFSCVFFFFFASHLSVLLPPSFDSFFRAPRRRLGAVNNSSPRLCVSLQEVLRPKIRAARVRARAREGERLRARGISAVRCLTSAVTVRITVSATVSATTSATVSATASTTVSATTSDNRNQIIFTTAMSTRGLTSVEVAALHLITRGKKRWSLRPNY